MKVQEKRMKKILVVSVNWLGDSIFALPVFENLKHAYPDSFIGVIAPGYLQEIYRASPAVDAFYGLSDRGFFKNLPGKLKVIRSIRKETYQQAIFLHRSFTKICICWLGGIPERIGYRRDKSSGLLTRPVDPIDPRTVHRADYYAGVLAGAGIAVPVTQYRINVPVDAVRQAEVVLHDLGVLRSQPYVCMHTSANWEPKRWPQEYFARLADRMAKEWDVKVLFTGAAKDEVLIQKILSLMQRPKAAFSVAGKTSLLGLAALARSARCVISADSGPLHLAAAAGANTVALFGPTSENITGPRGIGKSRIIRAKVECAVPCYDQACLSARCMESITVEDVYEAARDFCR